MLDMFYTFLKIVYWPKLIYLKPSQHLKVGTSQYTNNLSVQPGGKCQEGEFLCQDNRCIVNGSLCDARCDCLNCEDEQNCEDIYTIRSGMN